LPICADATPSPAPGEAGTSAPLASGTLLLVDDDAELLVSTGAMLEVLGFQVVTARDGVEALDAFQRNPARIRCVITDLTMPRLDGWGLLAALRRLSPELPVILASGYDRTQALAGDHPVQPTAFLAKPFGLQSLRDVLARTLGAE
jgi:CheY-like chemotaxis protein